jgi:hypothetical protein
LLIVVLAWLGYRWWAMRSPVVPTEIYRGVIYACERLAEDGQGAGLMHWVRVDLAAPGVGLYTTPVDPTLTPPWQQRLRYTGAVASAQRLAVTVNGTLYAAAGWPFPGRAARGTETVISEHAMNHPDPNSFLLWFEDDLTPHLESRRPASDAVVKRARYAIGGSVRYVYLGRVTPYTGTQKRDRRTCAGIDPPRKLLWLAVFEDATERRAGVEMLRLGATEVIPLDGGSSSEMVIGADAAGVRPGAVLHSWVPNATHLGIRATPLTP